MFLLLCARLKLRISSVQSLEMAVYMEKVWKNICKEVGLCFPKDANSIHVKNLGPRNAHRTSLVFLALFNELESQRFAACAASHLMTSFSFGLLSPTKMQTQ